MTYSPGLLLHICAGLISVLSGLTALIARKGARLHRVSGNVFVVSMLAMAASGAFIALLKAQRFNVFAGVLTFYLVATAWLTVRRKANERGLPELGLLLVALAAGASSMILSWEAAHRATGKGGSAAAYMIFGSIALLCSAGDVRTLRSGVSGAQRLVRHLWRMCFALLISVGSFFLGRASDPVLRQTGLRARLFTDAVRQTHLPEIPVLLVVVLTIFWLCRVQFTRKYKTTAQKRI
jgi:hypothetical protein